MGGGWEETGVGGAAITQRLSKTQNFETFHFTQKHRMQMYYKGCRVEGGVGAISNLKPCASESQTNALIAVMTELVYLGKSSLLMVSLGANPSLTISHSPFLCKL